MTKSTEQIWQDIVQQTESSILCNEAMINLDKNTIWLKTYGFSVHNSELYVRSSASIRDDSDENIGKIKLTLWENFVISRDFNKLIKKITLAKIAEREESETKLAQAALEKNLKLFNEVLYGKV